MTKQEAEDLARKCANEDNKPWAIWRSRHKGVSWQVGIAVAKSLHASNSAQGLYDWEVFQPIGLAEASGGTLELTRAGSGLAYLVKGPEGASIPVALTGEPADQLAQLAKALADLQSRGHKAVWQSRTEELRKLAAAEAAGKVSRVPPRNLQALAKIGRLTLEDIGL